jgi:hypothetical protein
MTGRLFQHSLHGYIQNVLRNAIGDVNNLDRKLFSDPALSGRLTQIAEKYSLDVARIDKGAISGKARQEDYQSREFGRNFTAKRNLLDVTIPFSGDPGSFELSPSQSSVLMHPLKVGRNAIILTVPDDSSAQGTVDTVAQQLTQNLDTIRTEYAASKTLLEQTIQQAAAKKQAEIAAEGDRDKGRTFKVER